MLTVIVFLSVVTIVLSIVIGINMSAGIDDQNEYFLFWFMFFITIATIMSIAGSIYFYFTTKDKTGPRGKQGPRGDAGDAGPLGECEADCKNGVCTKIIMDHILDILNKAERDNNRPGDLTTGDIRNVYLKSKVKSICASSEFKSIAPIKGQPALVSYLKDIWGTIVKQLYNAGGINYFKTIGAENEWDWVDKNPWDEFKKYDVYYWGLGKEYRPRLKDVCPNPASGYKTPTAKDVKYSIMGYLNIPTSKKDADFMQSVPIKSRAGANFKLYNAYSYEANADIKAKYDAGQQANMAAKINGPMTFLIGKPGQRETCYKIQPTGSVIPRVCDPYDPGQQFELEFTKGTGKGNQPFKLKNNQTGHYVAVRGNSLVKSANGEIFNVA